MPAIESLVRRSEALTSILGYWPGFHDAEVLELHLSRSKLDPKHEFLTLSDLTIRMHVFAHIEVLVTLRFHDVDDTLQIEGFNHQNVIFDLSISQRNLTDGRFPGLEVRFESSFGMAASFDCLSVEMLDAIPGTPDGTAAS